MSKRDSAYVKKACDLCEFGIGRMSRFNFIFHQANKEGRPSEKLLVPSLSKSLGIESRRDMFSDCEALKVLGGPLSSWLINVRKTRYGYLSQKIH